MRNSDIQFPMRGNPANKKWLSCCHGDPLATAKILRQIVLAVKISYT